MNDEQGESALAFRDYGHVLWRRRWVIVLTIIVAVGVSVGYDVHTKRVYQATAQLQLTPQISGALQASGSVASTSSVDVPTDVQILESSTVANAVKKTIPNAPAVSVAQVGTTNVVNVSVRSTSAKLAAAAANAYAAGYINVQQQQSVAALKSAEHVVQTNIANLQNQINAVQNQINTAPAGQQASLLTQLSSLQTQLVPLQNQVSQYQFLATLNNGGAQVVGAATVPSKPADPKPITNGAIAFAVGLVIGLGIALMLEYYDESIRTKEDLERVTKGLPTLGLIPSVGDWRKTEDAFVVSNSAPTSAPAEAYRSLRTSIQFLGLERSIRTLQFTSPNAADGKTTTLANMAVTMAQAGQSVVVVCCDLRRPRVHEFFGLSNSIGFTSVLLGTAELEDALQQVPDVPGLHLLASGPRPPNPSELLSGHLAQALLNKLASSADVVLVDSPPVLPVTDPSVIATQVDGVVLVTSVGTSSRRDVARALEILGRVEAPIIGVTLNRASEADSYAYYRYSYGSSYDSEYGTQVNGKGRSQPPSRHSRRKGTDISSA
jgi:succinoglycan biosynthesis transport protein ExoP